MKYKLFLASFFNHFIQPSSPPTAKLKSLHGILRYQRPHKNGPITLWLAPHMITSKDLSPNLYALPSLINLTTMIRQHTKFLPTARSPRET